MRVIVFANPKGGVGKTTMCTGIAVALQAAGLGPVAVIDTDRLGGLAKWWNKRIHDDTVAYAKPDHLSKIAEKVAALKEMGFKWVLIDTSAGIGELVDVSPPTRRAGEDRLFIGSNELAIQAADFVVIPLRPSPNDLETVMEALAPVHAANKPYAFIVNATKPNAALTPQAVALLSDHGPVCNVLVSDRTGYAAAMADGHTLPELDNGKKAAQEMHGVVTFLKSRFPEFKKPVKEKAHV